MAKPDLGEKQLCPECDKKFYDLNKNPALCPYCKASFDPAVLAASATSKPKDDPKPEDISDDMDEELAAKDEEDIDVDEVVAKELELDGDASFAGTNVGEDGEVIDAPVIDELPSDADVISLDDEDDILPADIDTNESLEDVLASEQEGDDDVDGDENEE